MLKRIGKIGRNENIRVGSRIRLINRSIINKNRIK